MERCPCAALPRLLQRSCLTAVDWEPGLKIREGTHVRLVDPSDAAGTVAYMFEDLPLEDQQQVLDDVSARWHAVSRAADEAEAAAVDPENYALAAASSRVEPGALGANDESHAPGGPTVQSYDPPPGEIPMTGDEGAS